MQTENYPIGERNAPLAHACEKLALYVAGEELDSSPIMALTRVTSHLEALTAADQEKLKRDFGADACEILEVFGICQSGGEIERKKREKVIWALRGMSNHYFGGADGECRLQ